MKLLCSPWTWLTVFVALYLAGRIAGPNDLHTKDQPKTVAYTVDVVENGNWLWPNDMWGRPATKPPLYNWVGAVPILATGSYNSFLFKVPSLLAGLGCLLVLPLFLRHLLHGELDRAPPFPVWFCLSGFAWLANFSVYGLIYTARPDMMLAFFLFTGWTIGTLLLEESPVLEGRTALWSALFWTSILGAILTKGTLAVLLLLYLPLYAVLRFQSLRPLARTHFLPGFLLVAVLTGFWIRTVWLELPQEHRDYLMGAETSRITEGGLLKVLQDLYKMPQYFVVRYLPWSLVFLWLFLGVHRARIPTNPWTPVYTWFLLLLVFFSIPTFKRDDYLLPVYPVCSVALGYAVWRLKPFVRVGILAVAAALMGGAVFDDLLTKDHLLARYGDNCERFARKVREFVPGTAELHIHATGYNNLQAYLGRNRTAENGWLETVEEGDYLLMPAYILTKAEALQHRRIGPQPQEYRNVNPPEELDLERIHLSAPISQVSGSQPGLLALYRVRGPN